MITVGDLSLEEGYTLLFPVLTFIAGMVVYAMFIFKFYRVLARKDIFELNLEKYSTVRFAFLRKTVSSILYVFKYALFFPFLIFFSFAVLTVFLVLLSKKQPLENILMVSISLISAVRVTAYYTEDLSRDLAKLLPFALLGILLVDVTYFSFSDSIQVLLQLPSLWRTLLSTISYLSSCWSLA